MNAAPGWSEGGRLAVAVASHSERMQALLHAYLMGPGRRVFVLSDESQAQAMIADYDNPTARADLAVFQARTGRPGIVLALRNPGLPGTCWVGKPIEFEALAGAAVRVHEMLCASPLAIVAQAPAQHANAASPAEPAASAAVIDESPPAAAPQAGVASRRAAAATGSTPLRPRGGGARRTFVVAEDADWTGKVTWVAATAIVVVAVGSLVGWQPAVDAWRQRGAVESTASGAAADTAALQEAVLASQREYRLRSDAERQYIAQQLDELHKKETPEELQLRLDRLARDPAALAAHNRNVTNRFEMPDGSGGDAAEGPARQLVQAAVSASLRSAVEVATGSFVSAIRPEAQSRVAEMRTVVVARGDTLGTIAARAYGSSKLYPLIFEANPRVLASPHHIYPGQVLRVPQR